ncbi:MAG: glycosyltransferase family 2 protein, partial [Christensenellaceae bacterium]
MKLITFAVPCYNSENYMCQCIDSLLTGGEDVEIIIVNDGSSDGTAGIADKYAEQYPSIVRAVHKENGGHGSGVNKGMEAASGLYYKVVDSDDWLDGDALRVLLETIRKHLREKRLPDLYLTNFVYEKVYNGTRFVRSFKGNFPKKEIFGWEQVKRFRTSSVLLMHSLVYRTDKLRASNTVLPEHTFYVDNIFAYKPLPYMEKLCYLDIDLYRYFIGRTDQSVSEENIVRRYEQQIRVMKEMICAYRYEGIRCFPKGLKRYMLQD